MVAFLVADIMKGGRDSAQAEIESVYAKVGGIYGVYRTAERVLVQYADDPQLGSEQRQALKPLQPIAGEINGLINGWRSGGLARERSRAIRFDRRVADAFVLGLQGDPAAVALMMAVKADIIADRLSTARMQYIQAAAATMLCGVALLSLAGSRWFAHAFPGALDPSIDTLWSAASVGAVGAFFSVALDMRKRPILTDLHAGENATDAILRVVVGMISAGVIWALLGGRGGDAIVSFSLIGSPVGSSGPGLYVAAFIAGFSERIVSDLLDKATVGAAALRTGAAVPGASAPPANEQNPMGKAGDGAVGKEAIAAPAGGVAAPVDDSEAADGCGVGAALAEDETTGDAELPASTGGVAAS